MGDGGQLPQGRLIPPDSSPGTDSLAGAGGGHSARLPAGKVILVLEGGQGWAVIFNPWAAASWVQTGGCWWSLRLNADIPALGRAPGAGCSPRTHF